MKPNSFPPFSKHQNHKTLKCASAPRTGKRWYNLRAVLNKRMLHPRDSAQYAGVINEVVTDFIKRIKHLREASSTGDFVSDVSNKFYLFSLEGKFKQHF